MNTYTVWFEFFGRKMKTTIKADSERQAMAKIMARIDFIKVEPDQPDTPEFLDWFGKVTRGEK